MEAGSQSHGKACENLHGSCIQARPRSVRISPLRTILQQHGQHQNKGKLATTYFPGCTIITEGGEKEKDTITLTLKSLHFLSWTMGVTVLTSEVAVRIK